MLALRTLAVRHQALSAEITTLDTELARLTAKAAPRLVALFGVGPDSAGALLVAAGGNPDRLRSEGAFSMLCGASPIEASSGKTVRHRLNRGGDRQANAALHRIVIVRLRWHQPTKDYMARRIAEGKTTKEVIRCLNWWSIGMWPVPESGRARGTCPGDGPAVWPPDGPFEFRRLGRAGPADRHQAVALRGPQ
jgi:transposase